MPTAATMPAKPAMLRAHQSYGGRPKGVDMDKGVIYGAVMALAGHFKDPRGQFNSRSLEMIQQQAAEARHGGLRSRFTHPSLSDDGLGKVLGRWKGPYLDTYEGKECVRADLHFYETSRDTPSGDLGGYVMRLAKEDPEAISSSLVIDPEEEYILNKDGTRKCDEDGVPLPPIWYPKRLIAADIVDTGAAVDGLLSAESLAAGGSIERDLLPDAVQRRGFQMLDTMFGDAADDVVKARTAEFVERYLRRRGGVGKPVDESRRRSEEQKETLRQLLAGAVADGVLSPFALRKLSAG